MNPLISTEFDTEQDHLNTEAYARWKGWGDPTCYGPAEKKIWDDLHHLLNIKAGYSLLEVGFGQGSHLHYARSKGYLVTGIETNKTGVEIAKKTGLTVYEGRLEGAPFIEEKFDAIIAIDVIEHIPLAHLIPFIKNIRSLLTAHGTFLMSFPNGASPFGRLHQHGDLTHTLAFNRESIEQLCGLTELTLTYFGDYPEYFELKTLKQKLKHQSRLLIRKGIRAAVRAYFDEPLGLSVVAILKKS